MTQRLIGAKIFFKGSSFDEIRRERNGGDQLLSCFHGDEGAVNRHSRIRAAKTTALRLFRYDVGLASK